MALLPGYVYDLNVNRAVGGQGGGHWDDRATLDQDGLQLGLGGALLDSVAISKWCVLGRLCASYRQHVGAPGALHTLDWRGRISEQETFLAFRMEGHRLKVMHFAIGNPQQQAGAVCVRDFALEWEPLEGEAGRRNPPGQSSIPMR
jgi:hypothetical protein